MTDQITNFFQNLHSSPEFVLRDISGASMRQIVGAKVVQTVDRAASWLKNNNVQGGDRIVAVFGNRLESAVMLLCAMRHGITLCLQPIDKSADDLAELASDVGAKLVVNASGAQIDDVLQFELGAIERTDPVGPSVIPEDTPLTVTFTSGSTGKPKGLAHSAKSFLDCAESFNRQCGITANDRFLNVMPMYYMAGIFNGILAPLTARASVTISNEFGTPTALRFWPTIRSQTITALWLSPTMLSLVSRLDRREIKDPESLTHLFVGTGAMRKQDAVQFNDTYGLAPLQSYGLSELLYVSVDSRTDPCFGSVGKPLHGVGVSHSQKGALKLETPYAFLGYIDGADIVPHIGAFETSDIGSLRGDALFIEGRHDDIIIRGGVNLNPVAIEERIAALFKGSPFCVLGLPDATLGQRVVLVEEDATRRSEDVISRVRAELKSWNADARIDDQMSVPKMPLGPSGKIKRKALQDMLLKQELPA